MCCNDDGDCNAAAAAADDGKQWMNVIPAVLTVV